MSPAQLPALTSIRFVFAFMVVGTHFAGQRPLDSWAWVGPLGNVAVSWFFVLSGFILTYNFSKLSGIRENSRFLVSRFWRLFPVQIVTIVMSLAMFSSSRHLAETQPYYLLRSLTLTHTWDASPFAGQAFNVPAWSISHEWFFYLMFPLILALGAKWGIAMVAACTALAYGWATARGCFQDAAAFELPGDSYSPTCISILFYWPVGRLWEFALGMALCGARGWISKERNEPLIQTCLIAVVVPLFIAQAIFRISYSEPYFTILFGLWELNVLLGAALIFALSLSGPATGLLSRKALVLAGEISFSIYMVHMLIIRASMDWKIGSDWPAMAHFIGISSLTIAISALIYLAIEKPSRAWLKQAFKRADQSRLSVAEPSR